MIKNVSIDIDYEDDELLYYIGFYNYITKNIAIKKIEIVNVCWFHLYLMC